jgi:peptidoglycan/LPS O-acetylase OafA/YrhL
MGTPVRHQYETLNALRGIAAMVVVLFHSSEQIGRWAPNGYLAVDMFFVLSGFVIAHSYDSQLAAPGGWKVLVRARIIRFWPMVALGVFCSVMTLWATSILFPQNTMPFGDALLALAAMFVLVPSPMGSEAFLFPLNIPLWTLALELYVSIAYAVFFRLLTMRALIITMAVSAACVVCFVLGQGDNDNGATVGTALGGLGRAVFGFVLGVLLFRLKLRWSAGPLLPALLLVICLCLPVPAEGRMAFDLVFVLLISPIVVVLGASAEPQGVQLNLARYLGNISFSLYVLHGPITGIFYMVAYRYELSLVATAILVFSFLLVLCPLVDRWYDTPVRTYLRRRLEGRRQAPAPAG